MRENLEEVWDLPEPYWPRSSWVFYYRANRGIQITIPALSNEEAWGKLEDAIKASFLFNL